MRPELKHIRRKQEIKRFNSFAADIEHPLVLADKDEEKNLYATSPKSDG